MVIIGSRHTLRSRLWLTLSLAFSLLFVCGLYVLWSDRRYVLLLNLSTESSAVSHRAQTDLGRAFRQVQTRAALVADLESRAAGPVDLQLMGDGLAGLQFWSLYRSDGWAEFCQRIGGRVQCRKELLRPHEWVNAPQWKRTDLRAAPPTAEYWTPLPVARGAASELCFRLDLGELLNSVSMSGVPGVYPFLVGPDGQCLCRTPENVLSLGHIASPSGTTNVLKFVNSPDNETLTKAADPLTGQPGWIVVLPLPDVQLSVGVFFPLKLLTVELNRLLGTILCLGAALFLILLGLVYLVSVLLSRPLEALTRAALAISVGEFEEGCLGGQSGILEVEHLRQAFSRMRSQLKEFIKERELSSDRRARLLKELELASQIQTSNLPSTPIFVRVAGCVVVGRTLPAREVGGDFLDAFTLRDGRVALLMGDVAGKGIPAALYTVLARNALKAALHSLVPLEQVLHSANELLIIDNPENMFVTALVAVFDPVSGLVEFARAGHSPPVIWSQQSASEVEGEGAPPLGVLAGFPYHRQIFELAVGEAALVYTDGISEAKNGQGELFGEDRLKKSMVGPPSEDGCEQIVRAVDAFRDGTEPNDDTTCMLLLRVDRAGGGF